MRTYELVLVMQATLTTEEKTSILAKIEEILGKGTIQEKDDIGVLPSAYLLEDNPEYNHIHLVSYYISTDPSSLKTYQSEMSLIKGIIRFFFYAMKDNQEFVSYAAMQKKLEKFIAKESPKSISVEEEIEAIV